MNPYPVTQPMALEAALFEAGLVTQKPWVWFVQDAPWEEESDWTPREAWERTFDARNPQDWCGDHLNVWLVGEWYLHLFRHCRRVLDVGCQEGRPALREPRPA